MAGYLFNLSDKKSLEEIILQGAYSTILNPSSRGSPYWAHHHESTVGDYVTMGEGDNVYFFLDRKIFGIGELVRIDDDCKYMNFPSAGTTSIPDHAAIREKLLLDSGEDSHKQRFVCFFKPSPYFFRFGVDMDDVLSSNPPAFKNLRAMWKRSFIKFDDTENQAFKNIILKRNQDVLMNPSSLDKTYTFTRSLHENVGAKELSQYSINTGIQEILNSKEEDKKLKHEMAVELGLLQQLSIEDEQTMSVFGKWDYLTHQLIASPFKPVDYMDRMDIFGYSYLMNYSPTINQYLIVEIKRDEAHTGDIDQLLRYVDWIKDEYCFGDYSMIKAYLLAHSIDKNIIKRAQEVGPRSYTIGVRPTRSMRWSDIGLISYKYSCEKQKIDFMEEWRSETK